MQNFSVPCCCSSNSLSPSLSLSTCHRFQLPSTRQRFNFVPVSLFLRKFPLTSLSVYGPHQYSLHATATETVKPGSTDLEFIETGYISSVHGLHGEVRVKPTTDFPDLRFSKPGRRWLRQQVSGSETLQEIELEEGRGHPGQSWILKFSEIDTVEQAQKLVGSTILVTGEDRPLLEEGEFYTRDLIGMTVILKETGVAVGTVIEVFNSGASDLLRVRLNTSDEPNTIIETKLEPVASGHLVWIPFVEAIVPDVDLERREMLITPPKGLLELNIRSDERSKKERRELEWKERKKFQRRLIAAKKKLCEIEQEHVFYGFRYGEKIQRSLLADQIVAVNSTLLRYALQNAETPSNRHSLQEILADVPMSNTLKVSDVCVSVEKWEPSGQYSKLLKKGHLLTSQGKLARVLVLEERKQIDKSSDPSYLQTDENDDASVLVKALLDGKQKFVEVQDRSSVPLILVCPAHSVGPLQESFSVHEYFGFDSDKVWFLEEEKLPVVSIPLEGQKHKILMKSPWEFLQTPIGSGGLISLLSSSSLLDSLSEMGVEYIEVCNVNLGHERSTTLLGLVDKHEANVGVQLFKNIMLEDDFNMVFSIKFMKRLVKEVNKLRYDAFLSINSYVEKVDKDWTDVVPSSPNSYEFRCSIYSCIDACPRDKVCVLDVTE